MPTLDFDAATGFLKRSSAASAPLSGTGGGAKIIAASAQSIPTGVVTAVTFGTTAFNSGVAFDLSVANTIKIPQAGIFSITSHFTYAADAVGNRQLSILKNGAVVLQQNLTTPVAGTIRADLGATVVLLLGVGDLITVNTSHSSTTAALSSVVTGGAETSLSVIMVTAGSATWTLL